MKRTTADGTVIARITIIGTDVHVYDAWRLIGPALDDSYSTIQHSPVGWMGRVGTEKLPAHLNALPTLSQERLDAVTAWQDRKYADAYEHIEEAFPETRVAGQRGMGTIVLDGGRAR